MVMLPRAYCHEAIWSNHLYKARLRLTLLDYSVGRRDRSMRNGDLRSEEVTGRGMRLQHL